MGPLDSADPARLDDLIHHIVERHQHVRETAPIIARWLDTLADVDGVRHPEVVAVRDTFRNLSATFGLHMTKEEHILFPFIRDLVRAAAAGTRPSAGPFGTLLNPIRVMEADHVEVESLLERVRGLTRGYLAPADASAMLRECYEALAHFEADLERHVRLENDELFPGARALESRVS